MILIIGCGFVGEAVAKSLEDNGTDIVRIDPKYNDNKIEDYLEYARGAIICLPTPTVDGNCDDSMIHSVLKELGNLSVLLKSTVIPTMLETYGKNVTYNPEFLRADSAQQDFDNQKHFILGGVQMECYKWEQVFDYLPNVKFVYTDRRTASMVKYMNNCWLATKVAFFHEVFSNLNESYDHDAMIKILAMFDRIGPSHMAMNDEGKLGFGGHCFPKDTQAFLEFSNSDILRQVIQTNNKLRDLE